jgi:hypothetical protein
VEKKKEPRRLSFLEVYAKYLKLNNSNESIEVC